MSLFLVALGTALYCGIEIGIALNDDRVIRAVILVVTGSIFAYMISFLLA